MATCSKTEFRSNRHGRCVCSDEDNVYLCADGYKFLDAGSEAAAKDDSANAARATAASAWRWAPWIIGYAAVVGGTYLFLRKR